MAARRIEITVSEDTWDRLDVARGHEPRASFVKRALEKALGPKESVIVRAQAGEFERAAKPTPLVGQRAAALERQRKLNEGKS